MRNCKEHVICFVCQGYGYWTSYIKLQGEIKVPCESCAGTGRLIKKTTYEPFEINREEK